MNENFNLMLEDFLLESGMDPEQIANLSAQGIIGTIVLVFLGIVAAAAVLGIINYVIHALGIFKLAKKTDVKLPWLAWIPYAQYFTMGKVVEQCDTRIGKTPKSWGKILLIANIGATIACAVLTGIANLINLIIPLLGIPFAMLSSAVSIAAFVLVCIGLWKIYREFFKKPANIILFVVGIVLNIYPIITLIASFRQPNPVAGDVIENVEYSESAAE